jgi:hypothetical protein
VESFQKVTHGFGLGQVFKMNLENQRSFIIRFEDMTVAEANIMTESLRDAILDSHRDVSIERLRDDPSAQDFGATLVLLLAAPAAVEVAKGIARWLERYQSAKLRIESPDGTLLVENLTGKQAIELTKLLQKG